MKKQTTSTRRSADARQQPRVLVVVPTYNEIDNLPKLIEAILKLQIQELDILVVDDNSPDGTGKLADDLSKKHSQVHVLHRSEKAGLGAAYAAAFAWALEHPYEYVITMDADFSHNPDDIPRLITEREVAPIVIGSRYIPGGKIVGWDWKRYANSFGGNIVTKILLGLPVRDTTAGFKLYRRDFLESLDLNNLISGGYAFQVEMLTEAHHKGYAIAEIPITFVDRRVGQSKIAGERKKWVKEMLRMTSRRQGLRQFIKFAIVGLINTIVDWVIFFTILHATSLGTQGQLGKQITKALSFSVAVMSSYVMNRRWTFRSTDSAVAKQLIKFLMVASFGLVLNNGIFYLITAPNLLSWPDIAGLILATGAVTFWNFFANKYWTFRPKVERNDQ